MKITSNTRALIMLVLGTGILSCEEFVQIDMPNSKISSETVFEHDKTALAAATGMYSTMLQSGSMIGGSFRPLAYIGGISSDELIDYTGTVPYAEFYDNELNVNNTAILGLWSTAYNTIYEANAVIEGVTKSTTLTVDIKTQLEGEGRFVRALTHFYLLNLFGDIPLATSIDYRINARLGRTSVDKVYEQIETDLLAAQQLLKETYSSKGRTRPNKWAATALLARVFLYRQQYEKAEAETNSIINNPMYSIVSDPGSVFLTNSSEAIWQLSAPYPYGLPTADALNFIIVNDFFTKALRMDLVNSFEANDLRKSAWIKSFNSSSGNTYFHPYKYKVRVYTTDANYPECLMILRLSEQYLIRAEARLEQGNVEGARSDLNVIRKRAGLADTNADDEGTLRLALENERRHELFCEMGHRWFDLKRTNKADEVLSQVKPSWDPTDIYYPIPEVEMLNNAQLTPQNDGY